MRSLLCCLCVVCISALPVHAQNGASQTANTPAVIEFLPEQKPGQPVPAQVHATTPSTVKVCVTEPKKNTKVVYSSIQKEYCVPQCSIFSWFGNRCGCEGTCEKRTRNVLVKKVVPACDTTHCVLKDVPVGSCLPCSK